MEGSYVTPTLSLAVSLHSFKAFCFAAIYKVTRAYARLAERDRTIDQEIRTVLWLAKFYCLGSIYNFRIFNFGSQNRRLEIVC